MNESEVTGTRGAQNIMKNNMITKLITKMKRSREKRWFQQPHTNIEFPIKREIYSRERI